MTETPNYTAIADALAEFDSHGIYSDDVLSGLAEAGYDTNTIPRHSTAATASAIERRGIGGQLTTEDRKDLVWGYEVSAVVARQLFGSAAGDSFFGRGSAHRANIAQIRAAGVVNVEFES